MSLPRLEVICTDKGAHDPATLGFLQFDVQRDRGVMSPSGAAYPITALIGDDLARYLLDPIYGPPRVTLNTPGVSVGARNTRLGVKRRSKRYLAKEDAEPTAWGTSRKDGGRMFTFACRTCGRRPQVRDDDLTKLAAHWPSDVLDISRIGR